MSLLAKITLIFNDFCVPHYRPDHTCKNCIETLHYDTENRYIRCVQESNALALHYEHTDRASEI